MPIAKSQPVLSNWEDRLNFGKHKGQTVREVLKKDPKYLKWVQEQTDNTNFNKEIKLGIKLRCREQHRDSQCDATEIDIY